MEDSPTAHPAPTALQSLAESVFPVLNWTVIDGRAVWPCATRDVQCAAIGGFIDAATRCVRVSDLSQWLQRAWDGAPLKCEISYVSRIGANGGQINVMRPGPHWMMVVSCRGSESTGCRLRVLVGGDFVVGSGGTRLPRSSSWLASPSRPRRRRTRRA